MSVSKKLPKFTPSPIFKGLPANLKDFKNYKDIEQRLRFAMVSDHKHKLVQDFMKCSRCQKKLQRKREIMKEVGFKNFEQYVEWRKVMGIIQTDKGLQR